MTPPMTPLVPSAPTPAPVLQLRQLGHRYGDHATFSRLDLSVAAGAVCCLLGPSGCGKTTVLRCIGGFERVSEGEVRLDGQVMGRAGLHVPPEQRRIGMCSRITRCSPTSPCCATWASACPTGASRTTGPCS